MSEALTPDVAEAIEELRATFPAATVMAEPDGAGGAFVTVDPVPLGSAFAPSESWIGFHITFAYPEGDVYPHFVTSDLRRVDGRPLLPEDGFMKTHWRDDSRPATQVSRRSNRWNPNADTATVKLLKVLQWLDAHE